MVLRAMSCAFLKASSELAPATFPTLAERAGVSGQKDSAKPPEDVLKRVSDRRAGKGVKRVKRNGRLPEPKRTKRCSEEVALRISEKFVPIDDQILLYPESVLVPTEGFDLLDYLSEGVSPLGNLELEDFGEVFHSFEVRR